MEDRPTPRLVVAVGPGAACQSVLLNLLPLVERGSFRLVVEPGHLPRREAEPYLLVHATPDGPTETVALRAILPVGRGAVLTVPVWDLPRAVLEALPGRRPTAPGAQANPVASHEHPSWRHSTSIPRRTP